MLMSVLNRIVALPLRNAWTLPVLIDVSRKEIYVEMGMKSTKIVGSVKVLKEYFIFFSIQRI